MEKEGRRKVLVIFLKRRSRRFVVFDVLVFIRVVYFSYIYNLFKICSLNKVSIGDLIENIRESFFFL